MDNAVIDHLVSDADKQENRTQFWKDHIDGWRNSKLTQRGYARKHNLAIARFTYWKTKLYPTVPVVQNGFVPVQLKQSQHGPVRLSHPSGIVIECSAGTDVSWLRSLLGLTNAT